MPIANDRRYRDNGHVPNRRVAERRKTKKHIHLFRRSADPSLWIPGVITIVIGAFVVWSVVELNSVHDLRVASAQHGEALSKQLDRIQMLETTVNSLLLLAKSPSRTAYMAASGGKN